MEEIHQWGNTKGWRERMKRWVYQARKRDRVCADVQGMGGLLMVRGGCL